MIEPSEKHPCNHLSRVNKAVNEMLGVIQGILFDGHITDKEALALKEWIKAHKDIHQIWPVFIIAERLERIFSDGKVDDEERSELKELLERTIGGGIKRATQLPLSEPLPELVYEGKVYVFTGKFAYGTRKYCEEAASSLGARCVGAVSTATDFLVIGDIGSEDWKYSKWGTKIHDAVNFIAEGLPIKIISEEHWVSSLH